MCLSTGDVELVLMDKSKSMAIIIVEYEIDKSSTVALDHIKKKRFAKLYSSFKTAKLVSW